MGAAPMIRSSARRALLSTLLVLPMTAWSGAKKGAEKRAAAYLDMGLGARAAGLGGAYVAVADDATGVYWNPAALAQPETRGMADVGSVSLGDDRSFSGLAVSTVFGGGEQEEDALSDDGTSFTDEEGHERVFLRRITGRRRFGVGAGALSFGIDDIGGRGEFGNALADFKDREGAYLLGFGVSAFEDLTAGVGLTYMTQKVGEDKATGMGFTAGALWTSPSGAWTAGVAARGMGGSLSWTVHDDVTQTDVKYKESTVSSYAAGVSQRLFSGKWLWTVEGRVYAERPAEAHAGIEFRPFDFVSLRAGLDAYDPTFGGGVNLPLGSLDVSLQYAFQNDLEGFEDRHWASLVVRF
jgi:hypothetical protein